MKWVLVGMLAVVLGLVGWWAYNWFGTGAELMTFLGKLWIAVGD